MRPQPLKYLSFAYWELGIFFKAIYDDGLAEWKAMATLLVTELSVAVALYGCVLLLLGHKLLSTSSFKIVVVAVALPLIATNYYALLSRNRWSRFKAEFESYSRFARIAGCVGVVGIVLGAIVGTLTIFTAARQLPY